jgi:hypothetical protein
MFTFECDSRLNIYRPSRGSNNFINTNPKACAVGYTLSPLRG